MYKYNIRPPSLSICMTLFQGQTIFNHFTPWFLCKSQLKNPPSPLTRHQEIQTELNKDKLLWEIWRSLEGTHKLKYTLETRGGERQGGAAELLSTMNKLDPATAPVI